MDAELGSLAEALGRGIAEGSPDLNALLSDTASRSVVPSLVPRLKQVLTRFQGKSGEWSLVAAQDMFEILRLVRSRDAVVYEELKAIAEAFAEDERARTAPVPQRSPDTVSNANTVSGGTFNDPVVLAGSITGGMHTYYGQTSHSGLSPVTDWPQLDRADAIVLGVRRPRRIADERPLPRYVVRDCDPALDAQVLAAAREGGLVLVTGEPLSGKTRTLWAALFTNLSGTTRILHPAPGTDLRGLTAVLRARGDAECVLWLDDLDGHLGEHGLTAALLVELARLRVPVLATMSDEAYDVHRYRSPAHARLLSGVEPVEVGTEWSSAEVERLAEAAPGDLRLAGAYAHRARHSTPAYLAVGPELLGEWRWARRANRQPLGHRLVLAAIDLARCGLEEVAADVLRRASGLYEGAAPDVSPEEFERALAWATEVRHGTTGMLVPGAEAGSWRAYGSLVEDARDGLPGFGPVPLALWLLVCEELADHDCTLPVTDVVLERARAVLGTEAETNPEALLTLGRIEEECGDDEAAEVWFRRAADAGSTEAAGVLGHLLAESREDMQAIRYLEQAAKAGDVRAQSRLGVALTEWSEYWLEKAAEADDAVAAIWLGDLRRGEGATHAALRWYRKAAELGLPVDVASRIGRLFRDRQDYKEAEKWFRIAVEEGDEEAANDLAVVLEHLGAKDEAALLYRQAAEAGSSVAAHNLGIVLNEKGDPAAAREWFARAHELGDYDAAYALGHSLMRENRHDEAEAWLRKAQEVGHHQAESALADLRAARSAHRPDTPAAGTPDNVKA
ncbi:sel1 repeat family protein [Streptomyces anulatus]|uniref:tetratricopeptide repeat protein n=1 Tax=Streptomyces anulatus TaxID=1892 RepID=UPI00224D598A|nr:tetratricopeptide repeat protein [Streptomyces anulatus]MCX4518785.1 sel1 repeat family protein [Streptomyces anulatus]MCX4601665.1 sel1 repeat family protein [Streptomyces anulatus]